jgi:hypothetical protein
MAVKGLKTHDPAKSLISRPNDFKDLRPPSRNRQFRQAKSPLSRAQRFQGLAAPSRNRRSVQAKGSFRFRELFWTAPTPQRNGPRALANAGGSSVAEVKKVAQKRT